MLRRSSKNKLAIMIVAVVLLMSFCDAFGSSSTDSFASDFMQDPCSESAGLLDYMECILHLFACGWFT